MRFSLKWILAAMVYVAIAAAAFGTGKWHFADVLWILTLLAVGYAILVAAFATGRRRVLSAGFAVLSVCFALCATVGGDAVPTARLVVASRMWLDIQSTLTARIRAADEEVEAVSAMYASGRTTLDQVLDAKRRREELKLQAVSTTLAVYLRAANAIATMAFGLMGSLVGSMAFRTSASGDRTKDRANGAACYRPESTSA